MLYGQQLPEGLLNQLPQTQPQFNSARDFFASPQFMALAAGILSQSGPSKEPTSLGRAIAAGMQNMQQTGQQGLDNQLKMADYNLRTRQLQNSTREMDLKDKEYQDKMNNREALTKLLLGGEDGNVATTNTTSAKSNDSIIPPMDMNAPDVVGDYNPLPIPNPNNTSSTNATQTPVSQNNQQSLLSNLNPGQKNLYRAYILSGHEEKALDLLNKNNKDAIDSPLNKELAKVDAATIKDSRESTKSVMALNSSLKSFEDAIQDVPSMLQGPIAGRIAPYVNQNAQTARAASNQAALLAKSILGMPNNNFSEGDREFLVQASAGLKNSPEANKKIIAGLRDLAQRTIDYNAALENAAYTQGNLRGVVGSFANQRNNNAGQGVKVLRYNPQTRRVE